MNDLTRLEPDFLKAFSSEKSVVTNPLLVYLAALAPSSRRVILGSLKAIAHLLTNGQCEAIDFEWHLLRYQHTAAIRSILMAKYAPATANRHLAALRMILKECRRLELISAEDCAKASDIKPIKGKTLPKGRALTEGEVKALFQVCAEDDSLTGRRDAAMLAIMRVGLRRSEVVNLDVKDFEKSTGKIAVRSGKGNKDRIVYLPSHLTLLVERWLELRGTEPGALLLPISKSNRVIYRRLSDQAVLLVLCKRGLEAGIDKCSPHDMRRTFAGDMLDLGIDISTVQRLMGHASSNTTAAYDRRGDETKRKAVEMLKW